MRIACYQPLNAGGGEAVLRHMLHIMTGDAAEWRNGRAVKLPACSERELVELPRFGPLHLWNLGHAEPVTIPRAMPHLREVSFRMGFGAGSFPLVTAEIDHANIVEVLDFDPTYGQGYLFGEPRPIREEAEAA